MFYGRSTHWFLVADEGIVFCVRKMAAFHVQRLQLSVIQLCRTWFFTVKLLTSDQKKPAKPCWNFKKYFLLVTVTFCGKNFDHMVGHPINKTTLKFVIFVKIHLITFHATNIYSFQNHYQKFSWWTLPWLLPVEQVRRESYLSEKKL